MNDWRSTIQGIIKTGQDLCTAKAELDHGEWGELTGRAEGSEGLLPFGDRTAQRLMEIASNPNILNATHASHLPASWYTLYELTKPKGNDNGII